VAAFIREEQPSIVLMVGAGISTSAGIPDFRTPGLKNGENDLILMKCLSKQRFPGTGLYDNLASYDIPHPHAIFEISYFKKNPEPFMVLAKELFHENIKVP